VSACGALRPSVSRPVYAEMQKTAKLWCGTPPASAPSAMLLNLAPVMERNRSSIEFPTEPVPTWSSRGVPIQ
jgi:hypothetical protein